MPERLLLINVAGLSVAAVGSQTPRLSQWAARGSGPLAVEPPIPALTSPSQATLLTGSLPVDHGIVANGWYFRDLALVLNWQRSARLVSGETLWDTARAQCPGLRCANLFWRHATHSACDVNVVERPTYWADGRKSPDIYTEPGPLRDELVERFGPFPLFRFWGPAAGIESTRWIVEVTLHLMARNEFELLMTYIPHLDYDHQRHGPDSPQGQRALREMDAEVGKLLDAAQSAGWQVAIVSDYAFQPVTRPIFLNRALREAGWIAVQRAENGELLEPGASRAFAVCDQQTAHVYVNDIHAVGQVQTLLEELEGVAQVFDRARMRLQGLDHPRAGELFAIAEPDCWFAYPYWLDPADAPDFANCVAIHAKPGWDPSELFLRPGLRGKMHLAKRLLQKTFGWRAPFDVISGDMPLVRGSHGRIPESDQQRPVLITSWPRPRRDLCDMREIKALLLERLLDE